MNRESRKRKIMVFRRMKFKVSSPANREVKADEELGKTGIRAL